MKRCPDCDEWKPLEISGGSRHCHPKRRYGIGATEVDALIEAQGGRCPMCERENPEQTKPTSPVAGTALER